MNGASSVFKEQNHQNMIFTQIHDNVYLLEINVTCCLSEMIPFCQTPETHSTIEPRLRTVGLQFPPNYLLGLKKMLYLLTRTHKNLINAC